MRENPSKNPFVIVAVRAAYDGRTIRVIQDVDEGVFWVGYDLTLENLNEGGPYGCNTFYDLNDAKNEMEDLV